MSINLHAKYHNGQAAYVPIISQRAFIEDWKPMALRKNLDWVLLLESPGFDVLDGDELQAIRSQFEELLASIEESALSDLLIEHHRYKINIILQYLSEAIQDQSAFEELYVG